MQEGDFHDMMAKKITVFSEQSKNRTFDRYSKFRRRIREKLQLKNWEISRKNK